MKNELTSMIEDIDEVISADFSLGEYLVYTHGPFINLIHDEIRRRFPGLRFKYRFYQDGFFVIAYRIE